MATEENKQQYNCYEIADEGPNQFIDTEHDEYYNELKNTTNDNSRGCISVPFTTKIDYQDDNNNGDSLLKEITTKELKINQLQQYKGLCEKRIIQLHPNHHLPITEDDIQNHQLLKETPVYKEKEEILLSLRHETLLNEEQRAYIETLKETIKSSLINNGLEPFLQKQNTKNQSGLDIIVSITKLKEAKEKTEKELQLSRTISNNTKRELEFYKRKSDDLFLLNKKLKVHLESESKEKDDSLNQLAQLNNTISALLSDNNALKQNNRILIANSNEYQLQNIQYKLDIDAKDKEITSLEATVNALSDIKAHYDTLISKHQELQSQYDNISNMNYYFESEIKIQSLKTAEFSKQIKQSSDQHLKQKNDLINQLQTVKDSLLASEKENKENKEEIVHKNTQIKTLKRKDLELTRTENELKDLQKSFMEYKSEINDKIKSMSSNLIQTKNELKQSKATFINLKTKEKSNEKMIKNANHTLFKTLEEMKILKPQNEKMALNLTESKDKLTDVTNQNEQLIDESNAMKAQNYDLGNEVNLLKEKYHQDIIIKENETNGLKKDINLHLFQIEELNHFYSGVIKDNVLKNDELIQADQREKRLRNEIKYLIESNNQLNAMINKQQPKKAEIKLNQISIKEPLPEHQNDSNNKIESIKPISHNQEEENILNQSLDSIFAMITTSYTKIQDFVVNIKKIIADDGSFSDRNTIELIHKEDNADYNKEANKTERKQLKEEDYMKTIEWFVLMSANEFETLYNNMLSLPHDINKPNNQNDSKKLYIITQSNDRSQTIKATLDISNIKGESATRLINEYSTLNNTPKSLLNCTQVAKKSLSENNKMKTVQVKGNNSSFCEKSKLNRY